MISEERIRVAEILKQILEGNLLPEESLKLWPECQDDTSILAAKHALEHFINDKDIREKDDNYEKQQISQLSRFKDKLEKGEPLDKNDIEWLTPQYINLPNIFRKIKKTMINIIR